MTPAELGAQWRPIETAPKDGTPILALSDTNDGSYEHVVVWHNKHMAYPWQFGYDGAIAAHRLAYWMPLPPPPSSGGLGGDRLPEQWQIDAVSKVLNELSHDPTAADSAIIITKKLVRALRINTTPSPATGPDARDGEG